MSRKGYGNSGSIEAVYRRMANRSKRGNGTRAEMQAAMVVESHVAEVGEILTVTKDMLPEKATDAGWYNLDSAFSRRRIDWRDENYD